MTQYIDKSALVAEIERRRQELRPTNTHQMKVDEKMDRDVLMWLNALAWVKNLLNTLEVKEVDLDGISRHYALNNSPWDDCRDEIQDAYKAGFELGMQVSNKAQKGK